MYVKNVVRDKEKVKQNGIQIDGKTYVINFTGIHIPTDLCAMLCA